jgi:hypothetical protein
MNGEHPMKCIIDVDFVVALHRHARNIFHCMRMAVNSTCHCWFSVTSASGKVSRVWLLLHDYCVHCASTSLLRFRSRVVVSDLRGGGLWWDWRHAPSGLRFCLSRFMRLALICLRDVGLQGSQRCLPITFPPQFQIILLNFPQPKTSPISSQPLLDSLQWLPPPTSPSHSLTPLCNLRNHHIQCYSSLPFSRCFKTLSIKARIGVKICLTSRGGEHLLTSMTVECKGQGKVDV